MDSLQRTDHLGKHGAPVAMALKQHLDFEDMRVCEVCYFWDDEGQMNNVVVKKH